MITEDYCSYEVAKLLKEKGFDAPCRSYYIDYEDYIDFSYCNDELTDLQMGVWETLRPTQQMAMKWLREIHNLWCEISWEGKGLWCAEVFSLIDEEFISDSIVHEIKSYEEAVEAALKYCLENLI